MRSGSTSDVADGPSGPLRDAKVPEVTLGFWLIKVVATTLGETGGDTLSMQFDFGYFASSLVFLAVFGVAVLVQVRARHFNASLYWIVIVATTTAGTTMADFADRSLGIGYPGGSALLLALLFLSLAVWRSSTGSVDESTVTTPGVEAFYWVTILLSQTLGTALGDWMADSNKLGYEGGAVVFGTALLATAALYRFTRVSRTVLFWVAFVLTRPLGATLGDFLDKPLDSGGLAFSRLAATLVLAAAMVVLLLVFPSRAARHQHGAAAE